MKMYMYFPAVIVLWCPVYASQGAQTDWSGDYGILGPVIDLGTDFWYDSDVNRLGSPGELALEHSPELVSIPSMFNYGSVVLDMDNDGDQDIAAVSTSPNGFRLLENLDGLGLSWSESNILTLSYMPGAVTPGDYNDDGFDDLIGCIAFYQDSIFLMTSPGGPGPWTVSVLDPDHGADCLVTADLNGDGLLDVAGGGYSPSYVCCWLNQGSGSFQFVEVGGYYVPSDMAAGDIDGDGDIDLVISSSQQGALRWFENLGQGTSWNSRYIFSSDTAIMTGVDLGDADGDGDLDMVSTRWYSNVCYWENADGAGGDWESTLLEADYELFQSPVMTDWDNDGDLDVAAAPRMKGPPLLFLNDGSAQNWERHEISQLENPAFLTNCDLNGDGFDDMIVTDLDVDTLVWLDGVCNSYSAGMLESSVIQVSIGVPDSITWGSITWNCAEPAGTSLGFALRADSTLYETISSQWSDTLTVSGSSLQGLFPGNSQYMQYMAVLESEDPQVTPVLHDVVFDWVVMGIASENPPAGPALFMLENPVRNTASLHYAVSGFEKAELTVYDVSGRVVRHYAPDAPEEGTVFIRGLPAGIYTAILHNGESVITERFVQLNY